MSEDNLYLINEFSWTHEKQSSSMTEALRLPSVILYIKHFWVWLEIRFCSDKGGSFSSSYFESNCSEFMLYFISGGGTGQADDAYESA